MIKQAVSIGTVALVILAFSIFLFTHAQAPLPHQAATTPNIDDVTMSSLPISTAQTRAGGGTQVTFTGKLHFAGETPVCFPKCQLPSLIFAYITVNGENYTLQGAEPGYPDGTQVTVTGWLHTPSDWPSGPYKTTVTLAGDITVTSIQAAT